MLRRMKTITTAVTVVAISAWIPVFFTIGPIIEQRLNPVISKAEILDVKPMDGGSLIWVHFEKYRECEFSGVSWHILKESGDLERVAFKLRPDKDESSSTRPKGRQSAGPWWIDIPPEDVREKSVVYLYYRCHPLWQTVAKFYP